MIGSYFELNRLLRIDLRIVRTETGEVLKGEGVSGNLSDIMKLEKQLLFKVAQGLDVQIEAKEQSELSTSSGESHRALILYSQGLDFIDDGKIENALKVFQEAYALDPQFVLARRMIEKLTKV